MSLAQFIDLPAAKQKRIVKNALNGAIKMQEDLLKEYQKTKANKQRIPKNR